MTPEPDSPGPGRGLVERTRRLVRNSPLEAPSRALAQRMRRVLYGADLERESDAPITPMFVPPGHFYSPVPSIADIEAHRARVAAGPPATLGAIDLRLDAQSELLDRFQPFYDEQPFPIEPSPATRYWFDNHSFGAGDALVLYFMLRHLRPQRVIEVGSGWSSCVVLDTCERFLEWGPQLTMIEPYPEQLEELVRADDRDRFRLIDTGVQQVPLAAFEALDVGDILFIDSTHVSRLGSDVNYEIFDVLPSLRAGVYVHFHDVFYPFDYPVDWAEEGRGWNEAYVLRAFLEYNDHFEIVMFNHLVAQRFPDRIARDFPLWLRSHGGSLWLRKVR